LPAALKPTTTPSLLLKAMRLFKTSQPVAPKTSCTPAPPPAVPFGRGPVPAASVPM
jgi:hypothetical protein